MTELFWLFPVTILASLAGLAAGVIVSDERLLRALWTACSSIRRLWQKRRSGLRAHSSRPVLHGNEQRSLLTSGVRSADKKAMRWARVFSRALRHCLETTSRRCISLDLAPEATTKRQVIQISQLYGRKVAVLASQSADMCSGYPSIY